MTSNPWLVILSRLSFTYSYIDRLVFCEAMWSRGGRSTRGGVRTILTQYMSLLAEHVQSTLCSFIRAVHKADNPQLVALCDLIAADIIGELLWFSNFVINSYYKI